MTHWTLFEPSALEAVRRKVQQLHPTTTGLERDLDAASHPLRQRLREAVAEDRLNELIRQLTPRERLTAVRCVVIWDDLRDAIVRIALERPIDIFTAHFWSAWEALPNDDVVRRGLAGLVRRLGTGAIHGGTHDAVVREWTRTADPGPAIVRWLGTQGVNPTRLPKAPAIPFRRDSRLAERTREWVLMYGSAPQLRTFSVGALESGWKRLAPEERMVAGARYLQVVDVEAWAPRLLAWIRGTYGMPGRNDAIERFWLLLDETTSAAFRRHFVDNALAKAFKGGTDRHRYWKRWGDAGNILDVELGSAGTTEWARLDFERFSVLEFFEVGNAAFFYTPRDMRDIRWGRDVASPAQLKSRVRNPMRGFRDNRLLHMPGWQARADGMVAAWSGQRSR